MRSIRRLPYVRYVAAALLAVVVLVGVRCSVAERAVEAGKSLWREDFDRLSPAWQVKTKPGTKAAQFSVVRDEDSNEAYLHVSADRATGTLMLPLENVDLMKTPVLRWRWRVLTFPEGADGRDAGKDDQAIGIYVGCKSGLVGHKSVAYRWETLTPAGSEGTASYAAGLMKVKWYCSRNQETGKEGTFVVEERNVAEDFEAAYGFIPENVSLGISSNSQYTGTQAAAHLDWIEWVEATNSADN
jgi:hypothetical protein